MEKLIESEVFAVDVPVAGELCGMSPSAAYRAVREGFMPVVKVGKGRVKVPLQKWRRILSGEASS